MELSETINQINKELQITIDVNSLRRFGKQQHLIFDNMIHECVWISLYVVV